MAIAEIGYHYLMNGALELASVVFEGLHAIAPDESYFALALGLVRDREGDKESAVALYARAASLDPRDPRPDVNRAELAIERGDRAVAKALLESARKKAVGVGDERLEVKAAALLRHLSTLAPMQGRVIELGGVR
jgi:Flp pilus assembly protein TadD